MTLKQGNFLKNTVSKVKTTERGPNVQLQESEEETANRLSPSVMGHILNSSSSSDEYEDIEYKRNIITSQDSLSTSRMRAELPNVA